MKEKKFEPKSGQIDYTNVRWAPVINCIVKYKNKILLVRRSKDMNLYPDCWNGISGFLDDDKSLEEKVKEELREEIGIEAKDIQSIRYGQIFDQEEPKYKKTWVVHPVLVEINIDNITLDWESQKYAWVLPNEAKKYPLLPGVEKVLNSFPF